MVPFLANKFGLRTYMKINYAKRNSAEIYCFANANYASAKNIAVLQRKFTSDKKLAQLSARPKMRNFYKLRTNLRTADF